MGSFNVSCFVSRQTIAPRDGCFVIPVRQASGYSPVALHHGGRQTTLFGPCASTCHPTRFWVPAGAALEAVYDDYGRAALSDTPHNREMLRLFLVEAAERVPRVEAGPNSVHDVALDFQAVVREHAPELLSGGAPSFEALVRCWDVLFEVGQEGRTFWAKACRDESAQMLQPRALGFAFVHRAAWDHLVHLGQHHEGFYTRPRDVDSVLGRLLDSLDAGERSPFSGEARVSIAVTCSTWARIGAYEGARYPGQAEVLEEVLLRVLQAELPREEALARLRPLALERYFNDGLSVLNLHFEPVVYASQDYDNEQGRFYADMVAEVSARVSAGREEPASGLDDDADAGAEEGADGNTPP